jgi:hypothetical protein
METEQTAVEWFYDTMKNKKIGDGQILIDIDTLLNDFEQAKAMEKEQNEYFFNCGRQYQLTGEGTFKQVHNETYGGTQC